MVGAILSNFVLPISFAVGLVVMIRSRLPISHYYEVVGAPARFVGALFVVTPLVALCTVVGIFLVGVSGGFTVEVGETLMLIATIAELLVASLVIALIAFRFAQPKAPSAEPKREIVDFKDVDSEAADHTFGFLREDEDWRS